MINRRADFTDRDFNVADLVNFDIADESQPFDVTQHDKEFDPTAPMVSGMMREYSILPGLNAVLLDGVILGSFHTESELPAGLTIYMGFKANGTTRYSEISLPHQSLPNILYVYSAEPAPIEQNTRPGPYRTVAIHFSEEEFRQMLLEDCLDVAERDLIIKGLQTNGPAHFWNAGPHHLESLQALFTNDMTGLDHKLFVTQTILGLLRALLRHVTQNAAQEGDTDNKGLRVKDIRQMHDVALHIENNLSQKLTLSAVARAVGCSESQLKQTFPRIYGDSLAHYVLKLRMNVARTMLASGGVTIQQVAAHVGYSNQASFTTAFKNYHSMTPREAFEACL